MKESNCDLARTRGAKDDGWRRHALGCPDCRELLAVTESMTALAAMTAVPLGLPSAGYLFLKARIRERQSAADRAGRPIYAMIVLTGILFAAAPVGVLVGGETRFGSVILDAYRLLASHAGSMIFGAVLVTIVSTVASYFVQRAKA